MMKFILSLSVLFFCIPVFSQVLNGKITDEQGEFIPFVNIRIENTSYGTVSNADGNYFIELKKGKYILKFSAPTYEVFTDTFDIKEDRTEKNIILVEKSSELNEVIIIPKTARDKGKEIMKQVIEKGVFFKTYFQNMLATRIVLPHLRKMY